MKEIKKTNKATEDKKLNKDEPKKKTRKRKRNAYYVNPKELLEEVKKSRADDKITDKLAQMFVLLAKRYCNTYRFSSYTYTEDMESHAVLTLVDKWKIFDPNESDMAFSYYTQTVKNAFKQYLIYEKKQRNARDVLLVKNGMAPSFKYIDENTKSDFDRYFEENDENSIDNAELSEYNTDDN